MEYVTKEVYFNKYCNKCVSKTLPEEDEPCASCLSAGVNINSHKPINFREETTNSREKTKP